MDFDQAGWHGYEAALRWDSIAEVEGKNQPPGQLLVPMALCPFPSRKRGRGYVWWRAFRTGLAHGGSDRLGFPVVSYGDGRLYDLDQLIGPLTPSNARRLEQFKAAGMDWNTVGG